MSAKVVIAVSADLLAVLVSKADVETAAKVEAATRAAEAAEVARVVAGEEPAPVVVPDVETSTAASVALAALEQHFASEIAEVALVKVKAALEDPAKLAVLQDMIGDAGISRLAGVVGTAGK